MHDDTTEPAIAPGFATVTDAARLAGVSRSTFHRAAVAGEVPYVLITDRRYFRTADVFAWRAARGGEHHELAAA